MVNNVRPNGTCGSRYKGLLRNSSGIATIMVYSVVGAIGLRPVAVCADPPPAAGYQLQWVSQFNGDSLNPLKWSTGFLPNTIEVNNWSDSYPLPGNVSVSGNTLALTAQRQSYSDASTTWNYTTGMINTSGLLNFTYGYIDADIKMPATLGTWPAFWMLNNGYPWPPEIDIEETPFPSRSAFSVYHATYHWNSGGVQPQPQSAGITYNSGTNLTSGFNNYGVLWLPNSITFFFNQQPIYTVSGSHGNVAQAQGMYLLLDLAIGGRAPGEPPSSASFPASMQVQNVEVWQLPQTSNMTSNWTGTGATASWDSGSSWLNGNIPTLGSEAAVFGQTGSGSTNVQWPNFQTVGNLTFNGGTTNYTLGQVNTSGIMLANDTGTATITANAYQGRSDFISIASEVELYSNTNIVNNMSNGIQIYGNIYGQGTLTIQNGSIDVHSAITNLGGINVDNNGSLILDNGTIGDESFSVGNRGTFGGTGTVSGPVSTASGSTLSPGATDSGGTLTIANTLTIGDGSNLEYYLSAPSGGKNANSLIVVSGTSGGTGNLTLGKDVSISLQSGNAISAGTYHLVSYSGQLDNLSGNFSGWTLSGFDLPGMTYNFSTRNSASYLDLVVSAVPTPEPATLLLFLLGGLVPLMRRKHRVKSRLDGAQGLIQNQKIFSKK